MHRFRSSETVRCRRLRGRWWSPHRAFSPPFVLDNRSSSSSSSSSLFAFQLAPRGGYLTIENYLGWSYELQSQLSYFLDVIAVASSTEVMVSVQNQTHRANVGFLSTTEDVKNTSNFTLFSSSYSLREASEKLARFNAVSFADESGIGSDVSVRSVRLRASSMSDDEGERERRSRRREGHFCFCRRLERLVKATRTTKAMVPLVKRKLRFSSTRKMKTAKKF